MHLLKQVDLNTIVKGVIILTFKTYNIMKTKKTRINTFIDWTRYLVFMILCFGYNGWSQPDIFKHIATTSNISGNTTTIDNPTTNGKPNAKVFVTHDYGSGPYHTSPIGVYYSGGKWKIFNQDRSAMTNNTKFNILVGPDSPRRAFVHSATSSNTNSHITTIDHPTTNNRPDAKIILTQHWTGTYNPHSLGVYYASGKWRIFNQDFASMPVGAKFNILINNSRTYVHTASSAGNSHITILDNSQSNNKPGAFVFVTNNWGTSGPYNPHEVGAWYNGSKWTLYNEDTQPIPANAKFNVIAYNPSASNLNGYFEGNDNGHYYVRQVGKYIYWFGEHPSGNWANVFIGEVNGTQIHGEFYDVPKGRFQGRGKLILETNVSESVIYKLSGSNFGGSSWSKETRPSNLPGSRVAGFQSNSTLTGRWRGNDNGFYYIRQIGSIVVWYGERNFSSGIPTWSNIAIGSRSGNTINLTWADVPKGNINNHGNLTLRVNNINQLSRTAGTGGFGGSLWNRNNRSLVPLLAKNTQDIKSSVEKSYTELSNSPNPFSDKTVIKIPDIGTYKSGELLVANSKGQKILTIPIRKDQHEVSLKKENLNPGVYFYSLIINGKIVGTRKMIIIN